LLLVAGFGWLVAHGRNSLVRAFMELPAYAMRLHE
jgi:hypothetical protein